MDNNNYELDYKAMFENLYKRFEEKFATELEYFNLIGNLNENLEIVGLVSKNMLKMSMADQLLLIRPLTAMGGICKTLNEKYNFEEVAEEGDSDAD